MKNKQKKEIPEEWGTDPQSLRLYPSSQTFPQTQFRKIEGKPPFMRILIHPDTLAFAGIHTDFPLIISTTNSLAVHAWPYSHLKKNEFQIDSILSSFLSLQPGIQVNLVPIDNFDVAERVVIDATNIPNSLSAFYKNTVILSGSSIFYDNKSYKILQIFPQNQAALVTPSTLFVSGTFSNEVLKPGQEKYLEKIKNCFSHFIICGPPGCGKSDLINVFISQCTTKTFMKISMPSLLSNQFGSAESKILSHKDKDFVILENIEVLSNDEVSRRLITAIAHLMEVSRVIFTTSDIDNFPNTLSVRVFEKIKMDAPDFHERRAILEYFLPEAQDLNEAAENSPGFVAGDLQRLVSESIIEDISLSQALAFVKPASLRNITLEIPHVRWTDIGGYEDAKMKLKESVVLPLEKPEAFSRLGIRPPKGVLLYGPPGCSKTLLAKAIATESKMNFLAVKGPELFNKYVGESEKAVAQVFKKARNASPAIIFFDEIDAMASKRGNTNVTDRVLTQLLTEMDGINPKADQSVVVIAATNRPDLLDPALMRPGRFDRKILISLPDESARKEIFRVHLTKMSVFDTDLQKLAEMSNGYSGAEIAAVCREAAMNALRENAENISNEHIYRAFVAVRPRTEKSLIKFYLDFQKGK